MLYRHNHAFRWRHFISSFQTHRLLPTNFLFTVSYFSNKQTTNSSLYFQFNSLMREIGLPILSQTQLQLFARSLSTNQVSRMKTHPTTNNLIGQYFNQRSMHSDEKLVITELEDKANDSPRDPQAQEAYLKVPIGTGTRTQYYPMCSQF